MKRTFIVGILVVGLGFVNAAQAADPPVRSLGRVFEKLKAGNEPGSAKSLPRLSSRALGHSLSPPLLEM